MHHFQNFMLDRAYADDLRLAAGLPRVRTTLNLLHRLILSLDGSAGTSEQLARALFLVPDAIGTNTLPFYMTYIV